MFFIEIGIAMPGVMLTSRPAQLLPGAAATQ
jgi:hypothetical protein